MIVINGSFNKAKLLRRKTKHRPVLKHLKFKKHFIHCVREITNRFVYPKWARFDTRR